MITPASSSLIHFTITILKTPPVVLPDTSPAMVSQHPPAGLYTNLYWHPPQNTFSALSGVSCIPHAMQPLLSAGILVWVVLPRPALTPMIVHDCNVVKLLLPKGIGIDCAAYAIHSPTPLLSNSTSHHCQV